MIKRMLIDATQPEETRVVVLHGTRLEEFDIETSTKKQLKGNIYLAKIVRVEPSLQAAFVEYGGNRHGFLAFNEIHPDYYQIPVSDRQKLIAEQRRADADNGREDGDEGRSVDVFGGDDDDEEARPRARHGREYKIQEVIKRRQIVLVQVVKEERGNKGAALTTYLSLAGRYCVLMPNNGRGGGVSRKITSIVDRKRLKSMLNAFAIPEGMAVILRTAGAERARAEIRRDYEYLMRTWNQIRETTMRSRAPALIHEEANLIKRAIRDIYSRDIDEVIVDGDEGYRLAKDFMRTLTPSHARKVQPYTEEGMPLFNRYQVAAQLDAMHSPVVQLRSGGYVVFSQTEALVAIDVNSGKATRERHIEETALKTNLEAAEEVARQLRLRDLAGLIVIDFIDMEESRNNQAVERRMKESMRSDRARIQMGRISPFGLLELSRQRLRPSLMETSFEPCVHCGGSGMVRSVESAAVHVLRGIEEEGVRRRAAEISVSTPIAIALYILNQKRATLAEIEQRYGFRVLINGDDKLLPPNYRVERTKSLREESDADAVDTPPPPLPPPPLLVQEEDEEEEEDAREDADHEDVTSGNAAGSEGEGEGASLARAGGPPTEDGSGDGSIRRRRRRRRRGRRGTTEPGENGTDQAAEAAEDDATEPDESDAGTEPAEEGQAEAEGDDGAEGRRSRRRGKRGGRRRRRGGDADDASPEAAETTPDAVEDEDGTDGTDQESRGEPVVEAAAAGDVAGDTAKDEGADTEEESGTESPAAPSRRRVARRSKAAVADETPAPKKRRATRSRATAAEEPTEPPAAEEPTEPPAAEEPTEPPAAEEVNEPPVTEAGPPAPPAPEEAAEPPPTEPPGEPAPRRSGWWRKVTS
ncbi:MAG: Rne/Rng family ribonuclease [Alphaproteobacteria bacterium]